jgi:hypothetical protein
VSNNVPLNGPRTEPLPDDDLIDQLGVMLGGEVEERAQLGDGSGFAVISSPLPADHWSLQPGFNVPPMPYRTGTEHGRATIEGTREQLADNLREAARYAFRASTSNGTEPDLDPDALVQNFIVGVLGYCTPDGLSSNEWANPAPKPPA